ncbi:MAG: hypothetical protein R3314_02155 [Longimicrobiales bacterium]|nr:hypothetical protein [Longimicrobiales bacterium]
MARYDRIARIDPPGRDDAFIGWLALRDLQEDERDAELGRRARLRFLAVRLIHRLARRGDDVDPESLQAQCDAVREELGQLPGRDPERQQLADLLKDVPSLDIPTIVDTVLELGETIQAAGHRYGAEELYRAALELAESRGLKELQGRSAQALSGLGASGRA